MLGRMDLQPVLRRIGLGTRLSTQPDSPFVQTLVVQRPYDDRIVTLRSRTLSADAPGVRDRRVVEDEDEFAAVLAGEFGLGLDTARNARLWERAVRQHEAFTATGRTA